MSKRLIIVFSVGMAVGFGIAYLIKRKRNRPVYEDLAGETRPIITNA